MVDPKGNLIMISKEDGGLGEVCMIPVSAFASSHKYHVTNTAILNIPTTSHPDPTGGDISFDGNEVLIRTHEEIYYWQMTDTNRDYVQMLSSTPGREVPVHNDHGKGEAVAWDSTASSYYTLSEGKSRHLYKYSRI